MSSSVKYERRLKLIPASLQRLGDSLFRPHGKHPVQVNGMIEVVSVCELPDDLEIVSAIYEPQSQQLMFVCHSSTFPVVPLGHQLIEMRLAYTITRHHYWDLLQQEIQKAKFGYPQEIDHA